MRTKKVEAKQEDPRYIVVSGDNVESLQVTVNFFITKGYSPVGGVAVNSTSFYQAMIRPVSYNL